MFKVFFMYWYYYYYFKTKNDLKDPTSAKLFK